MLSKFRDPMSTITHLIAFIFCIPVAAYMITSAIFSGSVIHIVAFAIFGASLVLLYGASSFYHMMKVPEATIKKLRKFDHMMVFVLIAGSYTPICLITIKGTFGYTLLILIWTIAFCGIAFKAFCMTAHRKITASIYILMGWVAAVALVPIVRNMATGGIVLLFLGGLSYTAGGIIYALKKPSFPNFDFHAIFHCFIVAGSAFHILMMIFFV